MNRGAGAPLSARRGSPRPESDMGWLQRASRWSLVALAVGGAAACRGEPPVGTAREAGTTLAWVPAKPMATRRTMHAAVELATGEVFVTAGVASPSACAFDSEQPLTSSEAYDALANTWTARAPNTLLHPYKPAAVLLNDGR